MYSYEPVRVHDHHDRPKHHDHRDDSEHRVQLVTVARLTSTLYYYVFRRAELTVLQCDGHHLTVPLQDVSWVMDTHLARYLTRISAVVSGGPLVLVCVLYTHLFTSRRHLVSQHHLERYDTWRQVGVVSWVVVVVNSSLGVVVTRSDHDLLHSALFLTAVVCSVVGQPVRTWLYFVSHRGEGAWGAASFRVKVLCDVLLLLVPLLLVTPPRLVEAAGAPCTVYPDIVFVIAEHVWVVAVFTHLATSCWDFGLTRLDYVSLTNHNNNNNNNNININNVKKKNSYIKKV